MDKLRFTPDRIFIESDDHVLELAYWHAGLGRIRRSKAEYGVARYEVPARPLLMADGRPCWHLGQGEIEVLQSIPFALRAVAAPFLSCQWLALEAMRHVDGFTDFLRQELAGNGPNFVLCCWLVGKAHSIGPVRRLAMAIQMMRRPRAALLAELSNLPEVDAAVVRLLAKAVPENVGLGLLVRMVGLAGNPAARRSLQAVPRLTFDLLEALCLLPSWLHHPEIAKAIADGAQVDILRSRLDDLLAVTRHDRRPALRRSLSKARGWGELSSRMWNWCERLQLEAPFPQPPISGSECLRPILDGVQLVAEGKRMQHCVADFEDDVRAGYVYFFRWFGEERATVQLSRAESGRWYLSEHLGRHNALLSPATVAAIRCEVAAQLPAPLEPVPATPNPPLLTPQEIHVAESLWRRICNVFSRLWGEARPGGTPCDGRTA